MHARNSGLAIRADRDLVQVHKSETGPSATSRDVRYLVAIKGRADISPTSPKDRV
jgi:hypothetical protein